MKPLKRQPPNLELLQSLLAPEHAQRFDLILFLPPKDSPLAKKWQQRFVEQTFPPQYRRHTIYWSDEDAVVAYFGIRKTPIIAVFHNGSMLSLIDDCDHESARWLCRIAQDSQSLQKLI